MQPQLGGLPMPAPCLSRPLTHRGVKGRLPAVPSVLC